MRQRANALVDKCLAEIKEYCKRRKRANNEYKRGALLENSPLYSHINTTDYKSVQDVENNETLIMFVYSEIIH